MSVCLSVNTESTQKGGLIITRSNSSNSGNGTDKGDGAIPCSYELVGGSTRHEHLVPVKLVV